MLGKDSILSRCTSLPLQPLLLRKNQERRRLVSFHCSFEGSGYPQCVNPVSMPEAAKNHTMVNRLHFSYDTFFSFSLIHVSTHTGQMTSF